MHFKRTQSRTRRGKQAAAISRARGRRLRVEALEDRRMLAVLTVTTLEDHATVAPAGSLRAMIDAANATAEADEIVFAAGLSGSILVKAQLPTITKALTITGPGAALLTLDAGDGATAAAGDGYRILTTDDAVSGLFAASISGLTLTGADPAASAGSGGAIRNAEALTLTNCVISRNSAQGHGGGVYSIGSLNIVGCTISDNTATGSGGGVLSTGSLLNMSGSTISGNTTTGANAQGGGLRVSGGGYIRTSTISGNTTTGAGSNGGGIQNAGFFLEIHESTVSGNGTAGWGAGFYNESVVTTITGSTLTNNTAPPGQGGGAAGQAALPGGGRMDVLSSIIAGNVGGDVAVNGGTVNAFQSKGKNVIGSGSNFGSGQNALDAFSAALGDQTNVANPLLGPLANNGGPTLTHAPLPGSPAIDRGSLRASLNVARAGTAWQSSEYAGPPGPYPASSGIDGVFGANNFAHTSVTDTNSTWQVTLANDEPISKIILYNRANYYSRLRDVTVTILDASEVVLFTSDLLNPENILGNMTLGAGPANLTIDVPAKAGGPVVGRIVRVTRTPDPDLSGSSGGGNEGEAGVLSLTEVEVYTGFDQRGLLGVVNYYADVGAVESQVATTPDFDSNGSVVGSDFLAWQRGLGSATALRAEGNSDADGDVDGGDLNAWRIHFGETGLPTTASAAALGAVASDAVASAKEPDVGQRDAAFAGLYAAGDFTAIGASTVSPPAVRARWRARR